MITFLEFLNENNELYHKDDLDNLTDEQEQQLLGQFDDKFGFEFENTLDTYIKELDEYVGFELTDHFKIRTMWRHSDKSIKEIRQIIKHIGLESVRKCLKYYDNSQYINKERSVLLYSNRKSVGIYVNFFVDKSPTVKYTLRLITILPPHKKDKSRSDDVIEIVESLISKSSIINKDCEIIFVN